MTRDPRFLLVLVCFFLSGFAALIYQTAWTRQFAFVFGTSELAVATVLAAYMGGLAAGAAVARRLLWRVRRPVLVYGLLELGIALSALAVPALLRAATALYVAWFGGGEELRELEGLAPALFYLVCAFAILLVPTGLMGATLPLLTRHAVHRDDELGARVATLYAINTAGAVAGALAAGFALLPALGLLRTIWVAIGANALVFAVAAALARGAAPPAPEEPVAGKSTPAAADTGSGRWVLPAMLLSGAVSFSYEVLWSRLLGHLLGGSVYGFATMLASFLAGIAIGSALAARYARTPRGATLAFAAAQVGAGALSLLAFLALDLMPGLSEAVAGSSGMPLVGDAAAAAVTLLPGALCIGATFPLAVRVLARGGADAGPASARVYAWNTCGAIAGAIGSGFFLLPLLGYRGLIALGVAANLALALAALLVLRERRARLAALPVAAALLIVLIRPPSPPWRLLRSSAIGSEARGSIVSFGVGRSATVLMLSEGAGWRLRTNGLPEALVLRRGTHARGDSLTQWLAAAPTLARPDARSMLVVGFGGGVVLESVPPQIESIDVVELEPEVLRANRVIAAERRKDPLADPRVRVIMEDARGALQLSPRRYDVIASQPSHPWTGGASHLYTREFFALARERLAPDGVLAQWMALHFVDAELLRALVASLLEVFPHVRIYQPSPGALLLLASPAPLELEREAPRAIAAAPEAFAELGLQGPEGVAAALSLDEAGARAFAAGAQVNTDDRNLLEMRSFAVGRERALSLADADPFAEHDPLLQPTGALDRVQVVRWLIARGFDARAQRVALATEDPVARSTALGLIAAASSRPSAAQLELARALAIDPRAAQARAALLRLRRHAIAEGRASAAELLEEPRDDEDAVARGWIAEQQSDWQALRALEPRLARQAPGDPLHEDALRLRILWRIAEADPALAREALALVDTLIPLSVSARDEILRARVLAVAGDAGAARITLAQAGIASRSRSAGNRTLAREARRLAAALPDDLGAADLDAAIRKRFR